MFKKNLKKREKEPPFIRLRLAVAIPLIITLFTLSSGIFVLGFARNTLLRMGEKVPAEQVGDIILSALVKVLIISGLGLAAGIVVAYAISSPLERLTRKAKELASGQITDLSPVKGDKEITQLAEAFGEIAHSLRSNILHSYALESLGEGVVTIDREGIITSFNKFAEKILGLEASKTIGMKYEQVLGDSLSNGEVLKKIAEFLEGKRVRSKGRMVITNKKGDRVEFCFSQTSMKDKEDEILGVVVNIRDLQEMEKLQRQLDRADQLVTLGSFTAGIAHEIRNPLGSIQGLVELLEEGIPPEDPKRKYINTILKGVHRLNDLMEDLLSFSRPGVSHPEHKDLKRVVREALSYLPPELLEKKIEVVEKFEEGLPAVKVDGERLTEAFLNILLNAYQATPEGGRITIFIHRMGNKAVVEFTNTGSFIPPEDREKIFTPFFSTKKKGTGLGLAIVHQIISAHSGNITVDSDEEKGTTFRIELPIEE